MNGCLELRTPRRSVRSAKARIGIGKDKEDEFYIYHPTITNPTPNRHIVFLLTDATTSDIPKSFTNSFICSNSIFYNYINCTVFIRLLFKNKN